MPRWWANIEGVLNARTLNGGWHLGLAARVVAAGGVIAYATESVYGLGCDPLNQDAVFRLLALKRRTPGKGLIVIASDFSQLKDIVYFPDAAVRTRVLATWPGPCTWVLPAYPGLPYCLTGGRMELAVRVTAHPQARCLCLLTGPLVSTSANPTATQPARGLQRTRAYFGTCLDYLLPGKVGSETRPSAIIHALTNRRLR